MQTLGEAVRASSMANWRLSGRDGLIKVMNHDSAQRMQLAPDLSQVKVKGYITQAKYIFGFNAYQIERVLGLPPGSMNGGAYIYGLSRLPIYTEVDFRYSLAFPDGKLPTPEEYEALLDRRDAALAGLTSEPKLYPPGGKHIPQWVLTGDGYIDGNIMQVVRQSPFKRDKAFSPHNKVPEWGRIL